MNPQPPEAAFYHFNAPAARIIVLDGCSIVCFCATSVRRSNFGE